jgi:hypothetical protein
MPSAPNVPTTTRSLATLMRHVQGGRPKGKKKKHPKRQSLMHVLTRKGG